MKRPENGPFYNLLALAILMVAAALLQQACGPWFWGLAKPPFLLAVAAYYALLRPLPLAIPAAFWAGVWADGLGSVPFPATLLASLGLLAACAFHGRAAFYRTPAACALLGSCAALATAILQAAALFQTGTLQDSPVLLLLRLLLQMLLAIPVVFRTAWAARAFERATGNIPPPEKGAPSHASS